MFFMILLTGSRGRLGTELIRQSSDPLLPFSGDFTEPFQVTKGVSMVIHAGAFTDVSGAEKRPYECYLANVTGTFNLVQAYSNVPFVFISSEYAKNPLGVYALSKAMAERVVQENHSNHLIIRTLFKPRPWPFEMAYEDQFTQGDYLDIITRLIKEKIASWDQKTSELCYVGTGRKTMLELALRTKPNVIGNKVTSSIIPKDYL